MLGKIANSFLVGFLFVVAPISSSFSSIAPVSGSFPKAFAFAYSAAHRIRFVLNFLPSDYPLINEYEGSSVAPPTNIDPLMSEYELSSLASPEEISFAMESIPSLPKSKEAFRHYFPLELYKSKARVLQDLKPPILHFPLSHKEIFNQLSLPVVLSLIALAETDEENNGFFFDLFTRDHWLSLPVIAKDIKHANEPKERAKIVHADDDVGITPAPQDMNAENSSHSHAETPRNEVLEEEHISENVAPFMVTSPLHSAPNLDDSVSSSAPAEEAQSDEERSDTSTSAPALQSIVPPPLTLMRHLSLSGTIPEVKKGLTTKVYGPKISVNGLRKTRKSPPLLPFVPNIKSLTGFVPGTGQRELDAAFDIVRMAGPDWASSGAYRRIVRKMSPRGFTAQVQILNPQEYRASVFLGKPRTALGDILLMPQRATRGNSVFSSIFNLSMTREGLQRFSGLFRGVNFSRPFILSIIANNRRGSAGLFQEEGRGAMIPFSMLQERREEGGLIEYPNTVLVRGTEDENDFLQSLVFNLYTAGQLLGKVTILRRKISGVETLTFAWIPLTRSRFKLTSSGNNPFSFVKRMKAHSFETFPIKRERGLCLESGPPQITLLRQENVLPDLALLVPSAMGQKIEVQDQDFPFPTTAVVSTNSAESLRAQILSMPRRALNATGKVIMDAIEELKIAFATSVACQNISNRFNAVAAQAPKKDFLTDELEDDADNASLFMQDSYVPFEFEESDEGEECVPLKDIATIEAELRALDAANNTPVVSPKVIAKIEEDLYFEEFLETERNKDLSFERFLKSGKHSDLPYFSDFRDELVAFA